MQPPPASPSHRSLRKRVLGVVLTAAIGLLAIVLLTPSAAFAPPADEPPTATPAPTPDGQGADETTPHDQAPTDPFPGSDEPNRPNAAIAVDAPAEIPRTDLATVAVTITQVSAADEIVFLEQRDGETWTALSSTTVGADNKATLTVAQNEVGTYSYRVRLAETTRHDEASSAVFTIAVKPDPTPDPPPPAEPPPVECGGAVPKKVDGADWVCTYDDEFGGTSLDRRYWVPQKSSTSNFFTGTSQKPACLIDDPSTIAVQNGKLVLSALVLDATVNCGQKSSNLVSGMVSHHGTFSQKYGKYEVRAKLPALQDKGLQETFWLWPDDQFKYGYAHPYSGEIDFAEFYSNYRNLVIPVMHYLLYPQTISYYTNTNIYTSHYCGIRYGEYNTYGLEWSPGLMRIFVNGDVCITNNYIAANATPENPNAPFDQTFFLALTQLFGTTGNEFDEATGPRESTTKVDYVRVWK